VSEPFVHRVEVHFYEVDQVGVVFNAWYLAWCDDARLAYLASRGYGLEEAREALSEHYLPELGEPFVTAGCCYYRDGRDSVAWHGDTFGRGSTHDTMVAIVSFGDPRRLALRPRGGGESISVEMGHGDLVVMGGSCQRTWEHSVPKVASAGPRVSVQFRPLNVF